MKEDRSLAKPNTTTDAAAITIEIWYEEKRGCWMTKTVDGSSPRNSRTMTVLDFYEEGLAFENSLKTRKQIRIIRVALGEKRNAAPERIEKLHMVESSGIMGGNDSVFVKLFCPYGSHVGFLNDIRQNCDLSDEKQRSPRKLVPRKLVRAGPKQWVPIPVFHLSRYENLNWTSLVEKRCELPWRQKNMQFDEYIKITNPDWSNENKEYVKRKYKVISGTEVNPTDPSVTRDEGGSMKNYSKEISRDYAGSPKSFRTQEVSNNVRPKPQKQLSMPAWHSGVARPMASQLRRQINIVEQEDKSQHLPDPETMHLLKQQLLPGPDKITPHKPNLLSGPDTITPHKPHLLSGPDTITPHKPHLLSGPDTTTPHKPRLLSGPDTITPHKPRLLSGPEYQIEKDDIVLHFNSPVTSKKRKEFERNSKLSFDSLTSEKNNKLSFDYLTSEKNNKLPFDYLTNSHRDILPLNTPIIEKDVIDEPLPTLQETKPVCKIDASKENHKTKTSDKNEIKEQKKKSWFGKSDHKLKTSVNFDVPAEPRAEASPKFKKQHRKSKSVVVHPTYLSVKQEDKIPQKEAVKVQRRKTSVGSSQKETKSEKFGLFKRMYSSPQAEKKLDINDLATMSSRTRRHTQPVGCIQKEFIRELKGKLDKYSSEHTIKGEEASDRVVWNINI